MTRTFEVKYKGLTKRRYKQRYGSSTPGIEKGGTCRATGLQRGLTIYPRAYKTFKRQYNALMRTQHRQGKFSTSSLFDIK